MLFVPLTTITMSQIPREEMGNATSLFNLMRNIGGSIGIATVTALNTRYTQIFVNRLGEHVTRYDAPAMTALRGFAGQRKAPGATGLLLGNQHAMGAMFGMVSRQAAMLAFVRTFLLLAAIFLMILPLILLMKRPRHGAPVEAAH
jgi:DHA2 family multidrug resistance protein